MDRASPSYDIIYPGLLHLFLVTRKLNFHPPTMARPACLASDTPTP